MEPFRELTVFSTIVLLLAGWTVGSTLGSILGRLYRYMRDASREAAERNKRIEFGAFTVGVLGLLLAVAGLIYSAIKIDTLEDRLAKLERVSAPPPSATAKPTP